MESEEGNNYNLSQLTNGIVRLEIEEDIELSGEHVQEYIDEMDIYYKDGKLPLLLVVLPHSYAISFSAMSQAKNNKGAKRMAIISKRIAMRRGLQLALRISKINVPIHFFNEEEQGIKWLLDA